MILYLLKSTVCLAMLFLVYRFFLEHETMHQFKRYFLIASLLFGLAIPLLPVNIGPRIIPNITLSQQQRPKTETIDLPEMTAPAPKPTATMKPSTKRKSSPVFEKKGHNSKNPRPFYLQFLLFSYFGITLVLFLRFLFNLCLLLYKIRRNDHIPFKEAQLVLLSDCDTPHSFLKYIFVDKKTYKSDEINQAFLEHERTHIHQRHSLDILFVELLTIVFWFNPLIYFYKKAIQLNHEFLADASVLQNSKDIAAYQRLLLKIKSSKRPARLASSIHYSITKKRLIMMKKKSPHIRILLKQISLIPLIVSLVFAFSQQTVRAKQKRTIQKENLKFSTQSKDSSKSLLPIKSTVAQLPPHLMLRNMFTILVNSNGAILANNQHITSTQIKYKVKQFITNNGADPKFSDSPEKAFIIVKATTKTPLKKLSNILERVKPAYMEVRNEAVKEKFGANYKDLKKNSRIKKKIDRMYPKHVFVSFERPQVPTQTIQNDSSRYIELKKRYANVISTYKHIDINKISKSRYKKIYKKLRSVGDQTYDLYRKIKDKYDIRRPPSSPPEKINETFRVLRRKYYAIKPLPENKDEMQKVRRQMKAFVKKWNPVKAAVDRYANYSIPRGPAARIKIYQRAQAKKAMPDTSRFQQLSKKYDPLLRQYIHITPMPQNKTQLNRSYRKLTAMYKRLIEAYKETHQKTKDDALIAPLPMKPIDRITVYYRQYPSRVQKDTAILNSVRSRYQHSLKKYSKISPVSDGNLKYIYERLTIDYDNWNKIFQATKGENPLPPLPETPESKIKAYKSHQKK